MGCNILVDIFLLKIMSAEKVPENLTNTSISFGYVASLVQDHRNSENGFFELQVDSHNFYLQNDMLP